VRAAEEHRPEVIPSDIGLPGDGRVPRGGGAAREPRDAGRPSDRAHRFGQEEDRERAREARFDEHLTKPADPAALESPLAGTGCGACSLYGRPSGSGMWMTVRAQQSHARLPRLAFQVMYSLSPFGSTAAL